MPGDKSISHRAAIIAALARGSSRISNYSSSQDCNSTLKCLRLAGVSVEVDDKNVLIDGRGIGGLTKPVQALDCGNSGSTMRMLTGVLAGQNFDCQLTGDQSLSGRPMRRIIEPLEKMGANIRSVNGKPPLQLSQNGQLAPIRYELPIASAQVKSCVLLAGLHAKGRTTVIEQQQTRDHTERMLTWYDCPIEQKLFSNGVVEVYVEGRNDFEARNTNIPGDVSSAAFLLAAAALLPGSDLIVKTVGLNPTRTQFLSELESFGADLKFLDLREDCNEPVGDIRVLGGLNPGSAQVTRKISGEKIPKLIDELPLLAVLGTQLPGGLEIRDARELRVKESDRLATTVWNLRAMGVDVEEYDDGLTVNGPTKLVGAVLDSHGDHRIAMAFAVAASIAQGESEILNADCVAVSFPSFFEVLNSLTA